MANTLFSAISDTQFCENFYENQIAYDKFGTLGYEFQQIFVNVEQILFGLTASIIDDLFVFKNGIACKQSVFFDSQNGQIDWESIWKMYTNEGATIYIRGLQKHIGTVQTLLKEVSYLFREKKLFANIFMSPPQSVGLQAHFDPTDFFVYQLAGEKQWDTWMCPPKELAEKMMPEEMATYCLNLQEKLAPMKIFNLRLGEALYVPRYLIHAPRTTTSFSIHITMGLAHQELRNRGRM